MKIGRSKLLVSSHVRSRYKERVRDCKNVKRIILQEIRDGRVIPQGVVRELVGELRSQFHGRPGYRIYVCFENRLYVIIRSRIRTRKRTLFRQKVATVMLLNEDQIKLLRERIS